MSDLISLGVLLILLAFLVLVFLYAQARGRAGEYRRAKKKFALLNEHLDKLRETMLSESDRWPMYARPVLFTEIDREAQVEFARAQQALAEAEQILPEIEAIEEPEIPDEFRLQDFFNIPKLLSTIFLNVGLAVFNLIPLPPLDGGKALQSFLPSSYDAIFEFLETYGILILFLLMWMGVIGMIVGPLNRLIISLLF